MKQKVKITRSRDAYNQMIPILRNKFYEEFWIILLNRANIVIGIEKISEGGISGTVVDPKKVMKIALDRYASSMILVHNHPSGSSIPSDPDKRITNKLCSAGEFLEIPVLDHIIFTDEQFYSFADEGEIYKHKPETIKT